MICGTCGTDSSTALTKRETEVAKLVGEGLNNRQISGRLFIAEKTAKNLVSSILMKLGLDNRTQIAIWVIRREAVVS
jgi:DNA-binding NarL/FixJ family response regulator